MYLKIRVYNKRTFLRKIKIKIKINRSSKIVEKASLEIIEYFIS